MPPMTSKTAMTTSSGFRFISFSFPYLHTAKPLAPRAASPESASHLVSSFLPRKPEMVCPSRHSAQIPYSLVIPVMGCQSMPERSQASIFSILLTYLKPNEAAPGCQDNDTPSSETPKRGGLTEPIAFQQAKEHLHDYPPGCPAPQDAITPGLLLSPQWSHIPHAAIV